MKQTKLREGAAQLIEMPHTGHLNWLSPAWTTVSQQLTHFLQQIATRKET